MDSIQRSTVAPEDDAFAAAFFAGRIANQNFHHRDHLRLAWVQIQRLGLVRASELVTRRIQEFATRHGSADRYNDTMTSFWLPLAGTSLSRHPEQTCDELPLP